MSVVIVAFEGAPTVSEEAKEREAELDSRLELKVKGDLRILMCSLLIAEWLACWTLAQKGPGSNRSRGAVG